MRKDAIFTLSTYLEKQCGSRIENLTEQTWREGKQALGIFKFLR